MESRTAGRVMGTNSLIVVHEDDEPLVAAASAQLQQLEQRWSRFLPDSEISVLNRANGAPVIMSPDTFAVVATAVDGCSQTNGLFDPTVYDAMIAIGYDNSFETLADRPAIVDPATTHYQPTPGVADILLDPALHAVTLPPGVRLDLGGIGKGTAADLVAAMLIARGARGAAVSVGGDIRVVGESPTRSGWNFSGPAIRAMLPTIDDGGICTSTTTQRRWQHGPAEAHHLIDPRTGRPSKNRLESVTILAATAQQAEVLTKAAMVAGDDAPALIEAFGVRAAFSWATDPELAPV
jgi:thiamine biosynthesis lipoprotein